MSIKKDHFVSFFCILLAVSSVSYTSSVLDQTLAPRMITFSATLCVFTIYFSFKGGQKSIQLDTPQLLLLSFCLYSALSSFWSIVPSETFVDTTRLFIGFLVFYYSSYLFKLHKNEFLKALQIFSIAMIFIELAYIGYQYTLVHWNNKDDIYVLTGLNSHKNLCSSYIFLNLAILALGYNQFTKKWTILNHIFIVLSILILITLKTKAIALGLITVLCVFGSFRFLKRRVPPLTPLLSYGLTMVSLLVFFMLVTPSVTKQLITYNEHAKKTNSLEYDNERLILWDKTFHLIEDNFWLGTGGGNWQIGYMKNGISGLYRAEDLNYTFQRPHNDWLWIISEYGIIGTLIFFTFLFILFTNAIRHLRNANADPQSVQLKLAIAFCFGFFVIQFFDFPKERFEHVALLHLLFGFIHSHGSDDGVSAHNPLKASFRINSIAVVAALILATAFSFQRIKGESNIKDLYDQHRNQNHELVLSISKKAKNTYYVCDPLSIPIDWYIGNSLASLNRFDEANKAFLSALKTSPYNRNVLNDLASSYEKKGMTDSAIYYFKEALKISPRFDDPNLNLAAIFINQGNYMAADSCLKLLTHDSERRSNYQRMVNAFLGIH